MRGINKGLGALNELLPEPLKSSGGGRSTGSGRIVSGKKVDRVFCILRRHFVAAFHWVVSFVSSAEVLCGVMNLPTPSQGFNKKESGLDTAVETVATVSMQIAAKEAKDVSGHSDIPVAIDGTWLKHGHTSLNGAVIATSFYTGKVLMLQFYQDFV
ncbi:hypothetical protein TNCV_3159621 [Trichonephila clavipes]|nr:hypothetical protein TNCV_3159621 [Trichonephila clavipes]